MTSSYIKVCFVILYALTINPSWSETIQIKQAKTKLKALDDQINATKIKLASAQDRRGRLNHELAENEKRIGTGILKLRLIERDVQSKQQKILELEARIKNLNNQLSTQQKLLKQHLLIRYKMGEFQPIKWMLNQEDPYTLSRLLHFHRYLLKVRQNLINQIATTKNAVSLNQENLRKELQSQNELHQNLGKQQDLLHQHKLQQKIILNFLNHEINTKQSNLNDYQLNKERLFNLLKNLSIGSVLKVKQPFSNMRKKLPGPLPTKKLSLQKMNQGLTFFAGEGTPVTAVYPGKVVFSDWLNGYGLLLIIDHGQGFMTLYAHNQSLFKKKGDTVLQGAQIASVGHSGGLKQNGLYFEIRHRGKALPPLEWLS